MATAAQNIANQSSASIPLDPATEGKSRVSQNALRHGLTARHIVIRKDEHEEFACPSGRPRRRARPARRRRNRDLPRAIACRLESPPLSRIEAESSTASPDDFVEPQFFLILDRLARYQARSQRAYYKALGELGFFRPTAPCAPSNSREERRARFPPSSISTI